MTLKNNPDDRFIIEETKLPNITDHASRVADMIRMRAMPHSTPAHVITDIMVELNVRIMQYEKHYKSDPLDFLIIQTVNDYRKWVQPRYEMSAEDILIRTLPVAIVTADNRPVYANPAIIRSDFSGGLVMMFVNSIDGGK